MKRFIPQTVEEMVRHTHADSVDLKMDVKNLFDQQLQALEITRFIPASLCGQAVETLTAYSMDQTYLNGEAAKILESQHNRQNEPDAYFEGAKHPLLKERCIQVIIAEVMTLLSYSGRRVSVAYDPVRNMSYCPAIIREFNKSLLLHNDVASREARGWIPIENVEQQWAFVVKLSACEGGETNWYTKSWENADEVYFNAADNYSYNEKVVEGYEKATFKGLVGTIILFNTYHYHSVEQVTAKRRITLGGFVGKLRNTNELIVWS